MPFYFTKTSDAGTSNPIVARISAGLSEIVKIAQLTSESRQQITDLLFDISRELLEGEKASAQVIREIETIERGLPQKMKNLPNGSIPTSIDSVLSINRARDFLKYSQSAFRKLGCIISVAFQIGNKEHRFWNISKELSKILSPEAQIFEIIEHYKKWYEKVMGLRDADEHHRSSKPFLINYEIKSTKDHCYLERPMFHDKTPVYEFLVESSKMLLLFCEDLILSVLIEYLPDPVEIVEIPLEKRNPAYPKRFKITLSGMGPE
jgi:hypothetical protein